MKALTDYEKGYLEAVIDAEGSLTIRKLKARKYRAGYEFSPMGFISNTNKLFLEKIKSIIGSGSIVVHQKYGSEKNYKPSFRYQFPRKILRELLPQLNLIVKKRQKELVLRALEITKGHKGLGRLLETRELENLVIEIRHLNKRGLNSLLE